MCYSLPLNELSEFTGKSIEILKGCTYAELETMIDSMKKKKAEDESVRNAQDQEFVRLVRKYFTHTNS